MMDASTQARARRGSPGRPQTHLPPHGFTLIELLLGVAILATLGAVVYGSLFTSLNAVDWTHRQAEAWEEGRLLISRLESELRCAFRSSLPTGTGSFRGIRRTRFGRSADRLDLHVAADIRRGPARGGEVAEVSWSLQMEGPDDAVLVWRRDETPDLEPFEGGGVFVLSRRVTEFDLLFYDGQGWHETWETAPEGGGLPRAVRVRLTVAGQTYQALVAIPLARG
jgi:type II secretion system protein J